MVPRSRPKTQGAPPFERVVELHGPLLLRFLAAQVGADRAEDCFQETMLAALRAWGEVRDASRVRPWLFAIAARKAVDVHRAERNAPQSLGELERSPASAPYARDEARDDARDEVLWTHVRRLPDKQRRAVALRYLADLSHREIASAMQTTEEAARRNVFEGLTRLRKDVRP